MKLGDIVFVGVSGMIGAVAGIVLMLTLLALLMIPIRAILPEGWSVTADLAVTIALVSGAAMGLPAGIAIGMKLARGEHE